MERKSIAARMKTKKGTSGASQSWAAASSSLWPGAVKAVPTPTQLAIQSILNTVPEKSPTDAFLALTKLEKRQVPPAATMEELEPGTSLEFVALIRRPAVQSLGQLISCATDADCCISSSEVSAIAESSGSRQERL